MRMLVSKRVEKMATHLANRFGETITFNRVKARTRHHESGDSLTYWEQPSFTCVAIVEATTASIQGSEGVLKQGDLEFAFAASELEAQSGTDAAGRSDSGKPKPGDTITYDGDTYEVDLGNGAMIATLDPTKTLWQVWARKMS